MKNRNELEKVINKDPFHQNDLAEYDVTEFVPSMTSDDLTCLLEK